MAKLYHRAVTPQLIDEIYVDPSLCATVQSKYIKLLRQTRQIAFHKVDNRKNVLG